MNSDAFLSDSISSVSGLGANGGHDLPIRGYVNFHDLTPIAGNSMLPLYDTPVMSPADDPGAAITITHVPPKRTKPIHAAVLLMGAIVALVVPLVFMPAEPLTVALAIVNVATLPSCVTAYRRGGHHSRRCWLTATVVVVGVFGSVAVIAFSAEPCVIESVSLALLTLAAASAGTQI